MRSSTLSLFSDLIVAASLVGMPCGYYARLVNSISKGHGKMSRPISVPAVFAPWAKDLLERAALAPGMTVLDVVCGTGVVARLGAPLVGPIGSVIGLDSNEAMLAVARAQPTAIGAKVEWRQGEVTKDRSR